MFSNTDNKPWDCDNTFGKVRIQPDSGQAHLRQWPLKLRQISDVAPYFHKAHLMLAADCAGFSYKEFHNSLLKDKILVIGCPELDEAAFSEKLLSILKLNDILSITLTRMDAPCCKIFADIVIKAVKKSGKDIPVQITTVFTEGEIVV